MARQCKVEESTPCHIEIRRLLGRQLKIPLVAVAEPVHPGFVAHVAGISVFGYGDAAAEAIEVLEQEIESLCRNEGFLDLRATVQRTLLLANIMAGEERDAQSRYPAVSRVEV
jgi:hypothetical protein